MKKLSFIFSVCFVLNQTNAQKIQNKIERYVPNAFEPSDSTIVILNETNNVGRFDHGVQLVFKKQSGGEWKKIDQYQPVFTDGGWSILKTEVFMPEENIFRPIVVPETPFPTLVSVLKK